MVKKKFFILSVLAALCLSFSLSHAKIITWGIAKDGGIFYRTGIVDSAPYGTEWTKVDGIGKEIVVTRFGHVWKIDNNNRLQLRKGVSVTNPTGEEWDPVEGKAIQIMIYNDDLSAIHPD